MLQCGRGFNRVELGSTWAAIGVELEMSSAEMLTKVEQLNKALKRCSAIMADGNSAKSNGSDEEEIKCLTNRY